MPVTGGPAQTRAQAIAAIAATLDQRYPGKGYGAAWTSYAGSHPTVPLSQLESAFAIEIGLGDLATGLGNAAAATGNATSQSAAGAVSGANQFASKFSWNLIGNWFLRIGEILLGLVLVGVGLVKLSGAAGQAIQKIPVYGKAIKAIT